MNGTLLRRAALLPIVTLLAVFSIAGCGLYSDFRDATRDTSLGSEPGVGTYRMRIVIGPVQNRSGFDRQGYPAMFGRTFAAALAEECDQVELIQPGDGAFPAGLSQIPEIRPGLTDNQAIAGIGRRTGANAVVTGTVYDISGKSERRGVLWFRKSKSFVQFNVGVAAFDMETGAKILDETATDEVEIDEFDLKILLEEGRIDNPDIEEALNEAAEDLAESTCEAIEELPWKGFLVSAETPVRITAGKNVGIKPGDQFDVYAPGKEMAGLDGQRFFLPGKIVARVRVVSAEQESATVEVVSAEAPLAPGYTVRPVD